MTVKINNLEEREAVVYIADELGYECSLDSENNIIINNVESELLEFSEFLKIYNKETEIVL